MLWQIPDMETAFTFRKEMYNWVGLPLPAKPAKKVLLWFRAPRRGRAVANTPDIVNLLNKYQLEHT